MNPEGDGRMRFGRIPSAALVLLATAVSATACTQALNADTVAGKFVRAYFVEDNMAQAVELASGSARVQLEGLLRQIEAVGAKEPAKDRPLVKRRYWKPRPCLPLRPFTCTASARMSRASTRSPPGSGSARRAIPGT
jgi:hypothetical protein